MQLSPFSVIKVSRLQAAVAAGILLAATGGAGYGYLSSDPVQALSTPSSDVVDLLGTRSPGPRTVAELTKFNEETGLGDAPLEAAQRALGKVFAAPPGSVGAPGIATFSIPETEALAVPAATLPVGLPLFTPVGSAGGIPSSPGAAALLLPGSAAPPGGGISAPPPGEGISAPPRAEVPAIPEPATWAMLILGFAMCGAVLRRPRRVRAGPRASACG